MRSGRSEAASVRRDLGPRGACTETLGLASLVLSLLPQL